MQTKPIILQPFTLAGISVRASNSEPARQLQEKIGGLWRRFFSQGLDKSLPNKRSDSPMYGVYSAYASDAVGGYTATVGVAVSAPTPAFDTIEIEGGQYLMFEARGAIPQAVGEAWGKIWAYFETSPEWKRKFTADFELYRGPGEVEIYIAVEAK